MMMADPRDLFDERTNNAYGSELAERMISDNVHREALSLDWRGTVLPVGGFIEHSELWPTDGALQNMDARAPYYLRSNLREPSGKWPALDVVLVWREVNAPRERDNV